MFNWLKRRSERDLDAEFQSHLAIEVRERIAAGEMFPLAVLARA